ncbi:MAG TPA: hypothetical protein VMF10_13085 [Candidatus Aquilonibacter sp.]|nr:hypothetical protein [Candidatus Aquilonibacter sp.]
MSVVLAVDDTSRCRNRASGHNLSDENNSSPNFVTRLSAYIKAKVHFIKIAMKRNWEESEKLRSEESKPNQADVGFSIE